MVDMLPFPRFTGGTPEEQMAELINYLIQFKETLEFALTNISTENLSPDLLNKLNELGADIEKSNEARENEITQISVNTLTIPDVCESDIFKMAIKNEVENNIVEGITIKFSVNFDTGQLEYTTSQGEV